MKKTNHWDKEREISYFVPLLEKTHLFISLLKLVFTKEGKEHLQQKATKIESIFPNDCNSKRLENVELHAHHFIRTDLYGRLLARDYIFCFLSLLILWHRILQNATIYVKHFFKKNQWNKSWMMERWLTKLAK